MALDGAQAARPSRIAICLAHFHPVVGGAERQMLQLVQRWARGGHKPVVFTRSVRGLPRREFIEGVEILRVIRGLPLRCLFAATYIASLAAQLVRAVEDAALRRSRSTAARGDVAANHDLDRVAGEILGEFEQLAAGRTRRGAVKPLRGV